MFAMRQTAGSVVLAKAGSLPADGSLSVRVGVLLVMCDLTACLVDA
jgi:hypothetical protein